MRLPSCFLCYTPAADAPPVSPLPAASSGVVTFGSFNNLAKITPQVRDDNPLCVPLNFDCGLMQHRTRCMFCCGFELVLGVVGIRSAVFGDLLVSIGDLGTLGCTCQLGMPGIAPGWLSGSITH